MKTHTLRKRRGGGSILTLTPAFEAKVASAHPYAASVFLKVFLESLARLGVHAQLDGEQSQRLAAAGLVGPAAEMTVEQRRAWNWLCDGATLVSTTVPEALAALDVAAHALVGPVPALAPASPSPKPK